MTVVRTISNPKLELRAELHRHQLNNPPPGAKSSIRFYCTVNGERPAASEMRDTEDEAARDAADAIGLPKDWVDPAASKKPAGK